MIISASKKFVLFHLPKNGGSSVQNALLDVVEANDQDLVLRPRHRLIKNAAGKTVLRPRDRPVRLSKSQQTTRVLNWPADRVREKPPKDGGGWLEKHATATQLKRFLAPAFYDSLKQVFIVRNPYARAFSSYNYYLKRGLVNDYDRKKFFGDSDVAPSFEAFLDNAESRTMLAALPQTHWIDPGHKPDYILHTETLARDLVSMLPLLGYDADTVLQVGKTLSGKRLNASIQPGKWRQMSQQARKLVERNYAEDFEVLGYSQSLDS